MKRKIKKTIHGGEANPFLMCLNKHACPHAFNEIKENSMTRTYQKKCVP